MMRTILELIIPRNASKNTFIATTVTAVHSGQNDYEIDAQSTGPFAPPFARLLAPLTHSLAAELMGKRFLSTE